MANTVDRNNYLDVLKLEFSAGPGSFINTMRIKLIWDKKAFTKLVTAMQICCEEYQGYHEDSYYTYKIERWLAEGFYYFEKSVKEWTQNEYFKKVYALDYYEMAYQRLELLASWFFHGACPTKDGWGFDPI